MSAVVDDAPGTAQDGDRAVVAGGGGVSVATDSTWPVKRMRFLTRRDLSEERQKILEGVTRVTFLPMEAVGERGDLDLSITRCVEEVRNGYTQFFDGDVLIAKITPCFENGKGAVVNGTRNGVGFGTTELHVLTPTSEIDARFLYYTTVSDRFRKLGEAAMFGAAGQKRVPEEFVREYRIPVPPLARQRAIADYLDRETARLDALVAAKERLLALLAEKRRAIVTRAVTRGLDPRVPTRDSGVPWLGAIPAHWKQCHLKRVLSDLDYGLSVQVNTEGDVAVLRMGDIRDGEIDYSNVGFVQEINDALLLQPGDLVFNRTNSLDQIGKVALFRGASEYPVSFASYLVRLRCNDAVLPQFLRWLLNSVRVLAWARSEALPAIGQANLNPYRYGYLPIALPPIFEQKAIVEFVEAACKKLDALQAVAIRTMELLKERRAALIATAVTGRTRTEERAVEQK